MAVGLLLAHLHHAGRVAGNDQPRPADHDVVTGEHQRDVEFVLPGLAYVAFDAEMPATAVLVLEVELRAVTAAGFEMRRRHAVGLEFHRDVVIAAMRGETGGTGRGPRGLCRPHRETGAGQQRRDQYGAEPPDPGARRGSDEVHDSLLQGM